MVRQQGSHQIWRCGNCTTVVPAHGKEVAAGTVRNIQRDLAPCLGEGWLA